MSQDSMVIKEGVRIVRGTPSAPLRGPALFLRIRRIPVAGKSTRTYPLTLTRPKPLLPVANRPILAHQLDALEGTVDTAVIVVGYRGEMIRERFGSTYGTIALEYVEQSRQLGTGHALLQCNGRLNTPFIVLKSGVSVAS